MADEPEIEQPAFRRYKARKLRYAFTGFRPYNSESPGRVRTYSVVTTRVDNVRTGQSFEPGAVHVVGPMAEQYLMPPWYFFKSFNISSTLGATPTSESLNAARLTRGMLPLRRTAWALGLDAAAQKAVDALAPAPGDYLVTEEGHAVVYTVAGGVFDTKYAPAAEAAPAGASLADVEEATAVAAKALADSAIAEQPDPRPAPEEPAVAPQSA